MCKCVWSHCAHIRSSFSKVHFLKHSGSVLHHSFVNWIQIFKADCYFRTWKLEFQISHCTHQRGRELLSRNYVHITTFACFTAVAFIPYNYSAKPFNLMSHLPEFFLLSPVLLLQGSDLGSLGLFQLFLLVFLTAMAFLPPHICKKA